MFLENLQNKHKDEIIFVIGSAPSVRYLNPDLLKKQTIIAVNGGIAKIPFAQYFVSDDNGIMGWSYFDIVKKSNCICLLYEDKFKNYINNRLKERTIFYKHKTWFSPPNLYNLPDGLVLTKDITKPIIGARTSFASAVHLAYCMGAKIIVLVGNDCQLSKDTFKYRYFWQYEGEQKQYRLVNKNHIQKNQNMGFDKNSFIEYWKYFYEVNRNIGVKIIDASDSCFDLFLKMNVKQIINKYSTINQN